MSTFLAQWLLFVYLNVCAGSIAFVLAWQNETRRNDSLDFLVSWATFFLSAIVLVETALGILHLLTPAALAIGLGAGAAAAWLVFAKRGSVFVVPPGWRDAWNRGRQALVEGQVPVSLVLVPWLAATFLVSALVEPSSSYDSFVYHLPMPIDWLQHAALTPAYIPMAEIANSYFPGNAELLYFWMLAPFRNDLLVRLVPIGMWTLLGLGLYRLCRQAGAQRVPSVIGAVIFLFTPLVLSESTELPTDVTATALFVLALGHLFEFARRPSLSTAALFGLASGLFLGVKYSGPAFLVLLLGAFAIVVLASRRSIGVALMWRSVLVVVLTMTATGAYWYLRNLVLAGNPVYPLGVSIAGRQIFPGPGLERHETIWSSAGSFHLQDMISALAMGYGVFFWLAIGMALVSAAWGLYTARHHSSPPRPRLPRGSLALIAGLMMASLLLYLKTPYSVMQVAGSAPITALELVGGMRFSLITGACATVLMAIGLNYMPKRLNPAWVVLTMALVEGLLAGYDPQFFRFFQWRIFTLSRLLVTGAIICVVLFALRGLAELNWQRVAWLRAWHRPGAWASASLAAMLVAGLGLSYLTHYREAFRYTIYQSKHGETALAWRWIDDNINHARVAYVGDARMLTAYGADFSNEVRYINTEGELEERYDDHYDHHPEAGYRINGSYDVWQRNLAAWSADYLVVASPAVAEYKWTSEHPETFTPVFKAGPMSIYRIGKFK